MDARCLKVFMIRHSISKYNTLSKEKLQEHNASGEHSIFYIKFLKQPDLLDCPLTDEGRALAARSAEANCQSLANIKLVLCTPARRALQTAEIFFGSRPDVVKVVVPCFERVESQGDIMSHTAQSIGEFPGFDFSLVQRVVDQRGWAWFIHELQNPHKKQELLKAIEDTTLYSDEPEHIAKGYRMVDHMETYLPQLFETFAEFHARLRRHKELIKRLLLRAEFAHLRDGEVALVAHHNFNRFFMAETFNEENFPDPCTEFKNAEVKEYSLSLFADL